MPNFSLSQLQVIKTAMDNIVIYMSEKEYGVKDYKELVKQRLVDKLTLNIGDKLSREEINRIIAEAGIDNIANSSIQVINAPKEYAKEMLEGEVSGKDKKIESIFGDTETGKIEYSYDEKYNFSKRIITAKPNFSICDIQISKVSLYDIWENENKESVLKVYIPDRQYEEKDYEELVHNKKRDKILEIMKEHQTNTKLTLERLTEMADKFSDKIEDDIEIVVATSPYEYAEMLQGIRGIVEYLSGDTKEEYDDVEFSLNMPQIARTEKIEEDVSFYDAIESDFVKQYCIYIPDDNYEPDVTYQYLCGLDYELERMREFIEIYKGDEEYEKRYQDRYNETMEERRKIFEHDEGEK